MRIVRRINHNAAVAVDGHGNELVVLGKGIGFPQVPYELNDLSKISKTFYDVAPCYVEMIAGLPKELLLASADVIEQAEINLDCELNPNIAFTLADHLNFAMERIKKGIDFTTPLAYDIEHLYPREYELGELALDIVEDFTQIRLPKLEIVNIAMHIINAEMETGDLHSVHMTLQTLEDVSKIIEKRLDIVLDKESFQYSRFTMHLRYLLQRFLSDSQLSDGTGSMLEGLEKSYPQIYGCALEISQYFHEKWSWECSKDEILYLMLHINRLKEKQYD